MTGQIERKKIVKYLQQSEVFCLPSIREPGGASILEAMACSLPVVVLDYGGPSYSVTKKCRIKIKPANPLNVINDISNAVLFLLLNKKIREKMGKEGRQQVISHFFPNAIEKKLFQYIQNV